MAVEAVVMVVVVVVVAVVVVAVVVVVVGVGVGRSSVVVAEGMRSSEWASVTVVAASSVSRNGSSDDTTKLVLAGLPRCGVASMCPFHSGDDMAGHTFELQTVWGGVRAWCMSMFWSDVNNKRFHAHKAQQQGTPTPSIVWGPRCSKVNQGHPPIEKGIGQCIT